MIGVGVLVGGAVVLGVLAGTGKLTPQVTEPTGDLGIMPVIFGLGRLAEKGICFPSPPGCRAGWSCAGNEAGTASTLDPVPAPPFLHHSGSSPVS